MAYGQVAAQRALEAEFTDDVPFDQPLDFYGEGNIYYVGSPIGNANNQPVQQAVPTRPAARAAAAAKPTNQTNVYDQLLENEINDMNPDDDVVEAAVKDFG